MYTPLAISKRIKRALSIRVRLEEVEEEEESLMKKS